MLATPALFDSKRGHDRLGVKRLGPSLGRVGRRRFKYEFWFLLLISKSDISSLHGLIALSIELNVIDGLYKAKNLKITC